MRSRLFAAAALVALAAAAACSSENATNSHGGQMSAVKPPPPRPSAPAAPAPPGKDPRLVAADLPLLPEDPATAVRPPEVVKAVYEFAARHPEVLKYVPCVCGCERMGHQGNDMCFVSGRDAAGKVTSWEPHGMICEVCLDIGRDSMRMYNSGASVEAIRKAIEDRYVVAGRTMTPTPKPPHKGGD